MIVPDTASESSSTLTSVAVGVSIACHVAAVVLSLGYAGAALFEGGETEAVPVTLVTPEQVAALLPPERPSNPASENVGKADLPPPSSDSQSEGQKPQSIASPSSAALPPQQPVPEPKPQEPAVAPPQPDISLRYQVDLGLKALPPPPASPNQGGTSDFDAPATEKADVDTANIAAFRAHLKQCTRLPAAIAADEKVMIVLRARFTPDGRLAAPPILIEASASAKGPALMQAAIAALQACQPHNTLPADKYAEWRVLDLRFTPQDFRKG